MAISFNVTPYYDDFETAGADGLSPKEKYQSAQGQGRRSVRCRLRDPRVRYGVLLH